MGDVWFGRGATQADFDAALQALSLSDKNVPLFAVANGEDERRLILASRALFELFDASSGNALSARLFDGQDPGARRLRTVSQGLPLDGAPRLERLRFFMGPGTEVITFLCRRVTVESGSLFVSAIIGMRSGLIPASASSGEASLETGDRARIIPSEPDDATWRVEGTPSSVPTTMNVQAIQAMLRNRWPASRMFRFTWQTDAEMVCTQVAPALADIVGPANADIVGHDMLKLAALVDPSGSLARAFTRKETWSGLRVNWPIADAAAAVSVQLGAIPLFDRDRTFQGYRGYGVIDRDTAVARDPVRFAPVSTDNELKEQASTNLVRFLEGPKELSVEDRKTFVELGEELREEAGLDEVDSAPPEVEASSIALAADLPSPADPSPLSEAAADEGARDIARHSLAILDKLAVGLLISRDNIPIFANRQLLDRLGFDDEDALYEAGGLTHLFNGRPDETSLDEAVFIRGKDGRIVSGQARIQAIDWDGLPATLLTLFQPADPAATTFDRDEVEVRELRAILETATDGVAVIDADCNVLSLNRSGEALFGCDRVAVIGKPFLSLFATHNQGLAADYLEGLKSNATKRLLNDGREFLVNAHPGGTIPVFMTLGRLSGGSTPEDIGATRFCALFRDLTHWKKVEQDLETAKQDAERANDLKSDFLAKVSHEIRTPLNAIVGFAEVMMDERLGAVGNERYKVYLRDIHASGTHVMSLVNDLLDLSKIEAGKMELAVEIIDVNKVVSECVAIMQPQASSARVIMRLSLAPTLPRIKADERSLRQIVLNILSNAVKFNEPGGQVIVATAATETGHVTIRIRDTGPGMSEADVAAALEPFRQLSTARTGVGGTGLGLPLTKALVEANQATFTIRSKIEHGTLVEVAFPPARVLAA